MLARLGVVGLALCLALCLAGSGCSFVFVESAPARPRYGQYVSCTTSRLAPGADLLASVAAFAGMLEVFALNMQEGDEYAGQVPPEGGNDKVAEALALSGFILPLVVGFGWSAWYGFGRTRHCRDVVKQVELERRGE